jgi:hypothetical protein
MHRHLQKHLQSEGILLVELWFPVVLGDSAECRLTGPEFHQKLTFSPEAIAFHLVQVSPGTPPSRFPFREVRYEANALSVMEFN